MVQTPVMTSFPNCFAKTAANVAVLLKQPVSTHLRKEEGDSAADWVCLSPLKLEKALGTGQLERVRVKTLSA